MEESRQLQSHANHKKLNQSSTKFKQPEMQYWVGHCWRFIIERFHNNGEPFGVGGHQRSQMGY